MDEAIFPNPYEITSIVLPLIGTYFFNELIKSIDKATLFIYSVQYQWKWNIHERHSKVQQLGSAIIRAKKRGVTIKVILNLESPLRNLSKINSVTNDQLAREGVEMKMLRPAGILHTKLWIIDGINTFVGSHNISGRSLNINEETSVKIISKDCAKFYTKYFDNLWGSKW